MKVQTKYISASVNRASNVADSRDDGLVVFGSGRLICVWNSADDSFRGIEQTLPGHEGNITVLKFARPDLFVSGDSTGVLRVWEEEASQWKCVTVLTGHEKSISAVALLPLENQTLIISGSSNGSLFAWSLVENTAELIQKFDVKGRISLELALTVLPGNGGVLLAVGATEPRLSLFASALSTINFVRAGTIEGHTDWIRSLDFTTPTDGTRTVDYDILSNQILLASGSQDNYIRLWKIQLISQLQPVVKNSTDGLADLDSALEGEIKVKSYDFNVGEQWFSCTSEAVLLGHDTWITGLRWSPDSSSKTGNKKMRLLSTSADRSMILWTPTPQSLGPSVWISSKRFGEFSSANNLGFFGALWGYNADVVLAHGWGGSWHVWKNEEGDEWLPRVSLTGHFDSVKSLAWEPKGEYFMTAGNDMTTRLHGYWKAGDTETWHELCRPQIHGYPIASIAFTSRLEFVSGADEKIIRVFDAPRMFLQTLSQLSQLNDVGDIQSRPMAANVPPLGLSNRAIASEIEAQELAPASSDPFDAVAPVNFEISSHPPFEEQLLGSTLWPETEKLYGHGYETIAVATAPSSQILATACKSTTAEHAVILLYSTKDWKSIGVPLAGHSLTITRMAFSYGERFLVSVSRDRAWHLYESKEGEFKHVATSSKHSRIIWDVAWAQDDSFFMSVSRDKSARVWATGDWECATILKFEEAATSVACIQLPGYDGHIAAVGLENGCITLLTCPSDSVSTWKLLGKIDSSLGHVLTVTSLAFSSKSVPSRVLLASTSEDRSCRLFEIDVTSL